MGSLEIEDIAGYLFERGLVEPNAIVDGGLRVLDVSRRNRVFLVTIDGSSGFVVKCAGESGDATIAREALVLERLRSHGGPALIVPAVAVDDRRAGVLVFETPERSRDLARHHRHHARGRFSQALARAVGVALAKLHACPVTMLRDVMPSVDRTWGLRVHRPDVDRLHAMSAAGIELVATIQRRDELCAELDDLAASSEPSWPIHGDVRWDNCVATAGRGSARHRGVTLIDWELACPGDRCVDVGTFLGEYLRLWLGSIPIVDARDPGRLIEHARYPLARMQPALRAFWAAYARGSGVPEEQRPDLLRHATRFAAVHLLEALFEDVRVRAGLHPAAHFDLQLATNILRRPDDAARRLLGLTESGVLAS